MSSISLDAVVISERTGFRPIAEANGLAVGCSAGGDDDGNDDQTQKAQNFDGGSDDFSLSEETNVHQVDSQNSNETNCNDYSRCDVGPVRNHDCSSRHFRSDGDGITVSVRDGESKPKSRVNKPSSKVRE